VPNAKVAKAFNTLFSSIQANPTIHGSALDAFFATDDDRTRATLSELLSSLGFRPVHVGPLARARELETLGWLNISLQLAANGDWRSAFVLVGAPVAATSAPVGAGASR
jgi:predicted dinucleotide-binding enzyme